MIVRVTPIDKNLPQSPDAYGSHTLRAAGLPIGAERLMNDGYSPIKGKCTWWRERPVDEDIWDMSIAEDRKRITCSCFVEGQYWVHPRGELPADCPQARTCRYYIKHT